MSSLHGKVAFVTGASAPQGIGRAIALRLAKEGASIVVADLGDNIEIDGKKHSKPDLLKQLVSEIQALNANAIAVNLDVTSIADIKASIAQTTATFGRLDILINNAGSLAGADNFLSTTPEQWELSFHVNILGPMMLAQAAIPEMRKVGGGRIINIGSTGSLGAEAGFGAYTAMKHGLVGLTKTLAAEFGADAILCNTVCPGYIATDMHNAANVRLAQENGISTEEMKLQRYADVAVKTAGLPEDVANAVAYLAGPQANYVTGINLPVAGGVPFGI
ncbi:3-oxoacyl-[acyl-carrier protein] reductase [hydrothermal vent metagenome]|uniref:3-oxoacyl-[acyl-carrier protein] reductase n=1 Tax=hydrothermal vent metagenome TaxID=652676 RepID=A0A3B0RSQ4_9ZZZZ